MSKYIFTSLALINLKKKSTKLIRLESRLRSRRGRQRVRADGTTEPTISGASVSVNQNQS